MKSALLRLLSLLLCATALLCLSSCQAPQGDLSAPAEEELPGAAALFLGLQKQMTDANGCFSVSTSSILQAGTATVRVELYAATDGEGIYQSSLFTADGKRLQTAHVYQNGALYTDDTVLTMTQKEYRAFYGAPSLPSPDMTELLSVTVFREVGGYSFTVRQGPDRADEYLLGVLGKEVYELCKQGNMDRVLYSFHFNTDGSLDRLSVRGDLLVEDTALTLSATVKYGEWGTAQIPSI